MPRGVKIDFRRSAFSYAVKWNGTVLFDAPQRLRYGEVVYARMRPDKPHIRIRKAAPDDAGRVALVLHESFVEHVSSYTDEAFAATTPASDQIRSRIDEGAVWVALQDDVVVGTVSAAPRGESVYVQSMGVLPAARGQRVGELLLKEAESLALTHGCKRLFLSTTPFLSRAIRLYERCGFRRSGEGPHDLFGTPLFTMEKILPAEKPPRPEPAVKAERKSKSMTDVAEPFIAESRRHLSYVYLPKVERCLGMLTDEDVWWRANSESNSIGNLLLHLDGSTRYWIVGVAGGAAVERDRQGEFDVRRPIPGAELTARLKRTLADADAVLASLSAERLLEKRRPRGSDVTVLGAVYHAVEHFSMHAGQVFMLAKARTGKDLKLYD